MRTTRIPVLAVLFAALATGGAFTGCETIIHWTGDGGDDAGDGGDTGDAGDGGDGADGGDGGDTGNMGDGGSGAWLSSFAPDASYVRAPATGANTYPTPLEVIILRGGESGAVRVDIASTNPTVASVSGGFVDIPPGSSSARVPIVSSAVGAALLTATFDGGTLQARVTTLPTVVISEIGAETTLSANDEFVELYNPTTLEFSLANYVLQYHSNNTGSPYFEVLTLDGGARIAPRGFFLIGVNSYAGGTTPDARSTGSGVAFSNSAGSVRLGAPGIGTGLNEGLALDTVGWGTGSVSYETSPMQLGVFLWGSLERKARSGSTASSMSSGPDSNDGNAHDTNDNSADFVLRGSRNPQSSASPTETPP